jgi:hypothetical protein
VTIPALATYRVQRETLDASFDLNAITPGARQPARLTFTDGYTGHESALDVVLPVAASERLEGRPLLVDGTLSEWQADD